MPFSYPQTNAEELFPENMEMNMDLDPRMVLCRFQQKHAHAVAGWRQTCSALSASSPASSLTARLPRRTAATPTIRLSGDTGIQQFNAGYLKMSAIYTQQSWFVHSSTVFANVVVDGQSLENSLQDCTAGTKHLLPLQIPQYFSQYIKQVFFLKEVSV